MKRKKDLVKSYIAGKLRPQLPLMTDHGAEYVYTGGRLPMSLCIFYIEKSYCPESLFCCSCPTSFQIIALAQWAFVDVKH